MVTSRYDRSEARVNQYNEQTPKLLVPFRDRIFCRFLIGRINPWSWRNYAASGRDASRDQSFSQLLRPMMSTIN